MLTNIGNFDSIYPPIRDFLSSWKMCIFYKRYERERENIGTNDTREEIGTKDIKEELEEEERRIKKVREKPKRYDIHELNLLMSLGFTITFFFIDFISSPCYFLSR